MKHSYAPLFIPVLATLFLAAGCNPVKTQTPSETTTAPSAAQTQIQPATTTPSTAPATTTTAKPTPTTAPKTSAKKPVNTTVPNSTKTVLIYAGSFSPQILAVKAGDTVVWVNKDSTPHTTASDGALLWDSGNLAPGQSYRRTFKATGTYPYRDSIKNFKGSIVVY